MNATGVQFPEWIIHIFWWMPILCTCLLNRTWTNQANNKLSFLVSSSTSVLKYAYSALSIELSSYVKNLCVTYEHQGRIMKAKESICRAYKKSQLRKNVPKWYFIYIQGTTFGISDSSTETILLAFLQAAWPIAMVLLLALLTHLLSLIYLMIPIISPPKTQIKLWWFSHPW